MPTDLPVRGPLNLSREIHGDASTLSVQNSLHLDSIQAVAFAKLRDALVCLAQVRKQVLRAQRNTGPRFMSCHERTMQFIIERVKWNVPTCSLIRVSTKGTIRNVMALLVKDRVNALLHAHGWTQEQLAERSAGSLTRVTVNKICNGGNKASTDKTRRGLAAAFSLTYDQLDDFLKGSISTDDAVLLARRNEVRWAKEARGKQNDTTTTVVPLRRRDGTHG